MDFSKSKTAALVFLFIFGLVLFLAAWQTGPWNGNVGLSPQPEDTRTAEVSPTQLLSLSPTPFPSSTPTVSPSPTLTPVATPTLQPVILVGAGDISVCGQEGDDQTAQLLDEIPGTVFTAGDNTNQTGAEREYTDCFDPSWGRHKDRLLPSPGNHDYGVPGARGYFAYFGGAAGEPGKGYYSYDLGEWHIIALNSNCLAVGGCGEGTEQEQWLRADLEANSKKCTLAYWHHPRWSSGLAGSSPWLRAFWQALSDYGAEIVISGHDHNYERFAPQGPQGELDLERGIRQFVVGTGGVSHRGFGTPLPNSEVRHTGTFGVIKFNLYPESYEWEFVPVADQTFSDSGSGTCH